MHLAYAIALKSPTTVAGPFDKLASTGRFDKLDASSTRNAGRLRNRRRRASAQGRLGFCDSPSRGE